MRLIESNRVPALSMGIGGLYPVMDKIIFLSDKMSDNAQNQIRGSGGLGIRLLEPRRGFGEIGAGGEDLGLEGRYGNGGKEVCVDIMLT